MGGLLGGGRELDSGAVCEGQAGARIVGRVDRDRCKVFESGSSPVYQFTGKVGSESVVAWRQRVRGERRGGMSGQNGY